MRTKALLLTAAVAAAGILSPTAQVFSVNAVGYVNKTIPAGFSMVANPLDAEDNTISALFTDPPALSTIYKWNGSGYTVATFLPPDFGGTGWDDPDMTLNPGEAAFFNPGQAPYNVTFVGEVVQGSALSVQLDAGFNQVGSLVPIAGTVDDHGLTDDLDDFEAIYKFDNAAQGYVVFTWLGAGAGGWDPSIPTIDIAEGVFVQVTAAKSWDRSFSVNN